MTPPGERRSPTSPFQGEVHESAARASLHQCERVGKELRSAEIPGLQRQQHVVLLVADRAQHRHAGRDFRTDAGTPGCRAGRPPRPTSRRRRRSAAARRARPALRRSRASACSIAWPAASRPKRRLQRRDLAPAARCWRSAPGRREPLRRPRPAPSPTSPSPSIRRSGSSRSTGIAVSAAAICSSVAFEQLPATMRPGPPTGAAAARSAACRARGRAATSAAREPEPDARRAGRERDASSADLADRLRDRARTPRRRSPRRQPCRGQSRQPRPRSPRRRFATVDRSTRPTLPRLWRASTRTRLASCIGLSGWSFSGLSFSGTAPTNRLPW